MLVRKFKTLCLNRVAAVINNLFSLAIYYTIGKALK